MHSGNNLYKPNILSHFPYYQITTDNQRLWIYFIKFYYIVNPYVAQNATLFHHNPLLRSFNTKPVKKMVTSEKKNQEQSFRQNIVNVRDHFTLRGSKWEDYLYSNGHCQIVLKNCFMVMAIFKLTSVKENC